MSEKYRKNIERISAVVEGKYQNKIQSGFIPENVHDGRKVGEIWSDSDDVKWEQKDGYRVKITKLASTGIAEQCSDCKKYISKKWDKDVYFWNGRCYYCQIDFESQFSRNMNSDGKSEYTEYLEGRGKNLEKILLKNLKKIIKK